MAASSPGSVLDADVRSAIAASNLRVVPAEIISRLAIGARRVVIPAGVTIHGEGEDAPHLELVVRGLVRVHVSSPDGRTLTIRYCRPGALLGVATIFGPGVARPFAIQALVDSDVVRLRPRHVRATAEREPLLTTAFLTETSERVLSFVAELSDTAFATVRRRVARHLLDLASEQQQGAELVARVSQQELADAVGTVREVLVPVLRGLREAGLIETGRGEIAVLRPDSLLNVR